jgi:hypothetical protein
LPLPLFSSYPTLAFSGTETDSFFLPASHLQHPKVLAAGDDETPAPSSGTHHGKHHRDEREAAKGDDASSIKKPNGHKHKTATKEKAEKEKPAEPVEKRVRLGCFF